MFIDGSKSNNSGLRALFRQLLTLVLDQQLAEATAQVQNHVFMFEKIY